jgi:hypothetical protein
MYKSWTPTRTKERNTSEIYMQGYQNSDLTTLHSEIRRNSTKKRRYGEQEKEN